METAATRRTCSSWSRHSGSLSLPGVVQKSTAIRFPIPRQAPAERDIGQEVLAQGLAREIS